VFRDTMIEDGTPVVDLPGAVPIMIMARTTAAKAMAIINWLTEAGVTDIQLAYSTNGDVGQDENEN